MAKKSEDKERKIIWKPQPRQELATMCPSFELFFGGAAGGGKTDFLIADFLDGVNYGKHHKGILFRKTYPEFEEIIDRSRDLYQPLGAKYNESKSKWTFPSGATIKFRALERDADVHKYQGHAYCVERSTKIMMSDGSYKRIDQIIIGDKVMTLEGIRKITHVVSPYKAPCVKMNNQINPIWHPVLTAEGWQSYSSLSGIDSKEFEEVYSRCDKLPSVNIVVKLVKRICYSDNLSSKATLYYNLYKSSRRLYVTYSVIEKLFLKKLFYLLHKCLFVLNRVCLFPAYVLSNEKPGFFQRKDYKGDYQILSRSNDEPLFQVKENNQDGIPLLNGVVKHNLFYSCVDVQGNIQGHSQKIERDYLHPYDGKVYQAEWESISKAYSLIPCGYHEVCDITVDHANHYITNSGIVNKNTWIGFDELPNWATAFCYTYMFSRCRSGDGLPCRIRGTGNPGSPGHVWVKNRFINNHIAEELYSDPETGLTRCFIPSLLDDNQILMLNDPDYEKRLMLLPPHLQRALRFGDWDVFSGQVFEEFNRAIHVVKPFTLDPSWTRFCSMDWGYAKPFSIGWWCVTGDGRLVRYREMYGCQKDEINIGIKKPAVDVAKESWDISVAEGCKIMVADPACWSKIDDTLSIAEKFHAAGWRIERANNDRMSGLVALHDQMKLKGEDGRPLLLVFDTCHAFIRTIPELIADTKHPEDIDTTGEDHVYDESRYGIMSPYAKRIVRIQNGRPMKKKHYSSTYKLSGSVHDRMKNFNSRR